MKPFRLFALTCLASTLVALAPAQQADDVTSLRAKAEKGNTLAQYNLGLAYAEGRGVPVDRLEAFVWLSLARERGAHGKALDTLISTLDKASLEMAQQRLADHKGTPGGKIPVVNTALAEPEILTTVKTTGAAASAPAVGAEPSALTQQITALTADKKQLSDEVAKAWKEIEALNAALKKSENEVRTASSQASAADQENAAKFNREVEASLNRTNELKSSLEKNLATVQAELDRTKAELTAQTQRTAKLAAAEASRLTPSAEMAALHNQLSAAQTQSNALTAELAAVRATETKLHDNIAQLEQEKIQLAAVLTHPDLSGKVHELEAAIADSTQKLSAAGNAQTELQRQLAEATETAKNAAKLSEQSAQLQRELDELSNRTTVLASENAELRTDRERLQKNLADSGKQLRDASADASRIKELETQTVALQTSLGEARAQASTLQAALSAKPAATAYPDLSGKVRDLEAQLAATNQQADSAVQSSVAATKQNTVDLNAAAAQIAQLKAALAAKPAPVAPPDLSGRVRDLETQLASATAEATRANQEVVAVNKAREADAKNHGPTYPNLAGRVVELQTALADTKRDLSDAQAALRTSEQARTATPAVIAAAPTETAPAADTTDLQKQLAASEDKLATALRGYAMLQREHDTQIESATKATEAVTAERNTLATQIAALSSEVEQLKAGTASQTASAQADATRAAESLAALQRSTSQNAIDLAAARALLQQVQGAYTVLANENYQLKTRLSPGGAPTAANASATPVAVPVATRTHVVAAGDTLSRISQRYYNTPTRWQEIYKANAAKLGATGVLRVGAELVIP